MIKDCFRTLAIIMFVCCTGVFSQPPQNQVNAKEAVIADSFGRVTNGYLKAILDLFLQEIRNRGTGTRGRVVTYGTAREAESRKRAVEQYLRFRSFDPTFISFVRGGNVSNLRTDLWILPEGAGEPSIAPEAFIWGEFGNVTSAQAQPIIKKFFLDLHRLKTHQAFIVNYGNAAQIKQREKWITNGSILLGSSIDRPRITLVRGGRKGGVKTVMWSLPPGSSNPHP